MAIRNVQRLYSCKRKRDYVKAMAIVLFAFLIVFQIALVVSLQGYLDKMEFLERSKRCTQLLEELDLCRESLMVLDDNTERTETNREEEKILKDAFDRIALFLRDSETVDNLTIAQVNDLHQTVRRLRIIGEKWSWWYWGTHKQKQKPYKLDYAVKDETIDWQAYVRKLEGRTAATTAVDHAPNTSKEMRK